MARKVIITVKEGKRTLYATGTIRPDGGNARPWFSSERRVDAKTFEEKYALELIARFRAFGLEQANRCAIQPA